MELDLAIMLMSRLPEWTKESRIEFVREILEEVSMLKDIQYKKIIGSIK